MKMKSARRLHSPNRLLKKWVRSNRKRQDDPRNHTK
jgi:hypothetical protein